MKILCKKVDSKIATISVMYAAGSRHEGKKYPNGIAHMLEHMFFKGTKTRTSMEWSKAVGFIGGSSNAYTSTDEVMYHISVPYENIEKAMELLSDMVLNPIFPEDEFLKEREVVKEEALGYLADFDWSYHYFTSDILMKGRDKYPIVGSLEDISSFTIENIRDYYTEFCVPERMLVGMSSNLSNKKSKELLEKYFGKADGKFKHKTPVWKNHLEQHGQEFSFSWPTMQNVQLDIIHPFFKLGDIPNEAASKVLFAILGSGMDSRLFETVREKNGLCYGIHAGAHAGVDHGYTNISVKTREENIPKIKELIAFELDRIKTELVSDEELERAKNKFRMSLYAKEQNSDASISQLMRRTFYKLPNADKFSEELFKVTSEDVMSLANKIFDQSKVITFTAKNNASEVESFDSVLNDI